MAGLVLAGVLFRDACAIVNSDYRRMEREHLQGWYERRHRQWSWHGERLESLKRDWHNPRLTVAQIEKRNRIARCVLDDVVRRLKWPSITRRDGRSGPVNMAADRYALYMKFKETMPWRQALDAAWAVDASSGAGAPPATPSTAQPLSPRAAAGRSSLDSLREDRPTNLTTQERANGD